jgi:2-C-methyl-D-erythritol 4-phosphate cytidylyltransferase
MDISAIIVGAGKSKRFGGTDKVFIEINGIPVLYYSLEKFLKNHLIKEIIVVLNEENLEKIKSFADIEKIKIVKGGETRAESVRAGVNAASYDLVLIHDAVRPIISKDFIQLIILSFDDNVDGVVPGIDVKYTIKERDDHNFVSRTISRDRLVEIQTPQLFKKSLLKGAYDKLSLNGITDEAMLVEMLGGKVKIINGLEENIKITTSLDFFLAEEVLRKWKK